MCFCLEQVGPADHQQWPDESEGVGVQNCKDATQFHKMKNFVFPLLW